MGYPDSGGRAQFAMPAALKKRPPMEAEPGEGKAHEMKESPEEEVREGSESGAGTKPTKRKRSARGAKHTKAPMDSDCGCGAPKGKKCSCDSGCGDYAKKMDSALTAQEYIAACDLGIQDRSRPYIRTRLTVMDSLTPTTVQIRTDKKCGASAIPDNKQCRVGAGAGGGLARKVATGAAIAGGVAAAAYGVSRMRRGGGAPRLAPAGGMPLARNGLGNRARRAAYNAGSRVRGAATNFAEGRRSGSFTPANSIANTARRVRNTNFGRTAGMAARQAGQGLQSAANSARFATRRGATFTAGNSIGNTARRVGNAVGTAVRNNVSMARHVHSYSTNSNYRTGYRMRRMATQAAMRRPLLRGDEVWAVGFSPEYA